MGILEASVTEEIFKWIDENPDYKTQESATNQEKIATMPSIVGMSKPHKNDEFFLLRNVVHVLQAVRALDAFII